MWPSATNSCFSLIHGWFTSMLYTIFARALWEGVGGSLVEVGVWKMFFDTCTYHQTMFRQTPQSEYDTIIEMREEIRNKITFVRKHPTKSQQTTWWHLAVDPRLSGALCSEPELNVRMSLGVAESWNLPLILSIPRVMYIGCHNYWSSSQLNGVKGTPSYGNKGIF